MFAGSPVSQEWKNSSQYLDQAMQAARNNNLVEAKSDYQHFVAQWQQIETGVHTASPAGYQAIEQDMAAVHSALQAGDSQQVLKTLESLDARGDQLAAAASTGQVNQGQNTSISDFLLQLQQADRQVQQHNQPQAINSLDQLQNAWFSVEGKVVSRSSSAYHTAEDNLTSARALLAKNPPDFKAAHQQLAGIRQVLTPLASQAHYSIWDAAMIPVREGLEALLVVGALLAFAKRAGEAAAGRWVWGGTAAGIGASMVLAVAVKLLFSSGAFGHNNFLISGLTGVFAAVMLIYMSYWLHSKSSIASWNDYLRSRSRKALASGSLLSLGLLAFLAVFREGTETVLFIIGMVNQISINNLVLGLLLGALLLAAAGYLIVFAGVKLPIRLFFAISSVIVFYLSLKFTGLGIHSLQLAGVVPATILPHVPSLDVVALYPTWQSAGPQALLVIAALILVPGRKLVQWLVQRLSTSHLTPASHLGEDE